MALSCRSKRCIKDRYGIILPQQAVYQGSIWHYLAAASGVSRISMALFENIGRHAVSTAALPAVVGLL